MKTLSLTPQADCDRVQGASVPDRAGQASPEAAKASSPSGDHPSRGCDHKFVYGGLRWANGGYPRPGSGAVNTYYGQSYFCERCLEHRVERVQAGDRHSYQDKLPESTPATEAERVLLVPAHDRSWGQW